ncbi:MAG TPA: MFS transporter [Gaiellaceae bacterium]|jgi:CP family cyanate transporter-like MFS transporter
MSTVQRRVSVLAVLGIGLVALNLRPAITSVGPVLDEIRDGLHLSGTEAALLTTAPVLCFGLLGPLGPVLARRLGIEASLAVALFGVSAGLLLRVGPDPATLFMGSVLAGSSIAVANVLMPAFVKRDFSEHTGLATGLYTMVMGAGGAIAAGVTVPLGHLIGHGWRGALGFWCVPAALALVAIVPRVRQHTEPEERPPVGSLHVLLRDSRAWEVTLYMGLQSLGFYAVVSWLPTIYQDHGWSATRAGVLLSIVAIVGTPFGILVPHFAARRRDQRAWVAATTLLIAAGFLGILLAPTGAAYLWAVLLGVGQSSSFPLALTLVALRTRVARDTVRLSALAQSVGYVIAALGPLALGAVHDATGSWRPPLVLLVALTIPQLVFGLGAGRPGYVRTEP